ncbi:helix-turn-helix domain-containing protein [Spectribacter hydrogenoxidans]|uniref:Helix-turn-helix domain-containing protein n=1 Tax=Spectribacter hydrogenoxidans TaxID=3075608 RepID=A0ABU3BZ33_9GAMM|nr:helix-turn-helix domain-containing protein [Salinisphaera sp. W335]MDT0634559.1 helix-turn-helix domain-containing protein [Salinisphaera sp. W335]
MPRRPASEQGDTLKQVREAAFSLFGRYGYDGVSMLAVARAAGLTKAALYWHYDGKEALYTDCVRQLNALFRRHVFTRMAAEDTPIERLMAIFRGMGTLLADPAVDEGVAGYWLMPSTADVAEARAVQGQFEEASARVIGQAIQAAVDDGDLTLDIPVADMAQAVMATMEAIVLPLRRSNPERSRRLIAALAHTFFRAHAVRPELARMAMGESGLATT